MHTSRNRPRLLAAGFTLVELMIGMALGLLSVLIITQVMSLFEAQRRTTTGSADAQTNGGIALYSIARELQMAGFGLMPITNPSLDCTTVTYGGTGITGMAPVAITDGVSSAGVNASDSITLRYATSATGGTVSQITGWDIPTATATLGSNVGCSANDVTLISAAATCAMSTALAVSAWGVSPVTVKLANTTNAANGTNFACLGQWNEITYAVNQATGNLDRTVRVNGVATTTPSVVGVVNLQAQYGVSASATSNQIIQWVDATAAGTWDPATITAANRNRIKALRISVIARNAKIEPSAVSSACSSTTAAAPTGVCAWDATTALPNPITAPFLASPAPTVDLHFADANWAKYRYRVFETIVPLRNVVWARGTL